LYLATSIKVFLILLFEWEYLSFMVISCIFCYWRYCMIWHHLAPLPLWVSWDIVRLLTIEKTRKHDTTHDTQRGGGARWCHIIQYQLCDYSVVLCPFFFNTNNFFIGNFTILTQLCDFFVVFWTFFLNERFSDVTLSVICYSFLWSLLPDKFSNNVQLTTDSWY
jgi:hypothetical protein